MKKVRKISMLLLIIFLINFFLPETVFATAGKNYHSSDSVIKDDLTGNGELTSSASVADENGILDKAKTDGAATKFRNLKALNANIDKIWEFVRWCISFLCVFGTISSFFILTKSFLQLAWIPDHPMQRRKVYVDILTSGVCTILFGGLALIMTLFYKSFEEIIMSNALYNRDYKSAFALFLIEYKYIIAGADAVMALTLVILLIKDILELAMSGGNPRKREEAVRSILFTILGIVGCGAVGLIVGIFTGMLTV